MLGMEEAANAMPFQKVFRNLLTKLIYDSLYLCS